MDIISNYPILKSFLAGSLSGTCSTVMFQPLDLVKTRLQNPVPVSLDARTYHSAKMFTIIGHIVQKEHVFGLWKGMTPSLTRCVPGVGLYFMCMDLLKNNLVSGEPGPLQAVAIGMMARTLSGVCLIPVTVVKTRFESGVYHYGGVIDALRVIYRTEGVRGLSCGLVPTLVRDAPFSGLYLMFYTQIKKLVPSEWLNSNVSAPVHFSCGIGAGILASFVTQPADVLKTKMQLYPSKFGSTNSVILYVYQKYGVQGYFKGLVPRMLRRTLMASMAWTVYEQGCIQNLKVSQKHINDKLQEISTMIPQLTDATTKLCDANVELKQRKEKRTSEYTTESTAHHTAENEMDFEEANKMGLTDFALETSGGAILSTPETETFTLGTPPVTFLGVTLCYPMNSPRAMIQPGTQPGECWAFKGSEGTAVIRLLGRVFISSVSLEHIPSRKSPTGDIRTAPREFSLWGLQWENETFFFGKYFYNSAGKPVQNFKVKNVSQQSYPLVQVKFHSNYGHPNYTCVYRLRVHGTLDSTIKYGRQ